MMLISVMVSAPYSSLSAAKRFSLESPEDTHRARQAADYRGGKPPEALHSARVHKHTHTHSKGITHSHTYTGKHIHAVSRLSHRHTTKMGLHVCTYIIYNVYLHYAPDPAHTPCTGFH